MTSSVHKSKDSLNFKPSVSPIIFWTFLFFLLYNDLCQHQKSNYWLFILNFFGKAHVPYQRRLAYWLQQKGFLTVLLWLYSLLLFISVCVSVFVFCCFFLSFSCLLNLYIICPKQQNPQLPSVKSVKHQFQNDRSTSLAVPVVQNFIKNVSIT